MRRLSLALLLCVASCSGDPAFAGHRSRATVNTDLRGGIHQMVTSAAQRHGVPVRLAHGLIRVESGYNCRARNRSGAAGIGQLMPATARALGVRNPMNCAQNLEAAMRYLRLALNRGGQGCAGLSLYERGTGARPTCTAYGRKVLRQASL